jgi:hypothetical protein
MRCAGRVLRLFCTLGILAIGLASVAQAAGADRKAHRTARENRVLIAARERANAAERREAKSVQRVSARTDAESPVSVQLRYIQRLVSAEQFTLNYENGVIAAENRLITQQNRVVRQLNGAVNPNRILALQNQALGLQASINHDLTFLSAIQPTISATLTALQAFVSVGPGVARAVNNFERIVGRNDQRIAVIAARPPFTIQPATPAI